MSGDTVAPAASTVKRLGVYALFDCDRRPSQAFLRTINAARNYPLEICKPARPYTGCAACGCPAPPEWPAVDLHAVDPL